MIKKVILFLLISCGTNRKFVSDHDNDNSIDEIKRDIADSKELISEKEPSSPSIWTGKGTDSYLFFSNTGDRKLGDLVVIDVFKNLRNEISTELQLDEKSKGITEEKKESEKPEGGAENDEKPSDQISTVIDEEVNQTHYILKGKKAVVYKGTKRLLELKTLVAKKDIQTNDRVSSKNLLETTIRVIR